MTRFDEWMLKRIAKRLVTQGPLHQANMTEYYRVLTNAARVEFNEDNKPTLDALLQECHTDSLTDTRQWKLSSYDL